ncbi:MAG: hypothetical protein ACLKAK_09190 [Alkaliphilus sp.]
MAIYELLKHLSIEPFIDLNPRTKHNLSTACDIQISPKGVPISSSKKWKDIYKRRSSVERSNKREKIDCHLEDGRHRSTKMWTILAVMMCQHIDAWYSHLHDSLLPANSSQFGDLQNSILA